MSFRILKLTLEYDGTTFCGWQIQKKGTSIQGVLQGVLKKLTGEKINVIASGRTDAGVHALGQVAHFRTNSSFSPQKFRHALNALLPPSIVIREIEEAAPDFHAILHAQRKLYAYYILNDPTPSVFLNRTTWQIKQPLDWKSMEAAFKLLKGRHDFKSFQSAGASVKTTEREIYRVEIQKCNLSSVIPFPSSLRGEGQGEGDLECTFTLPLTPSPQGREDFLKEYSLYTIFIEANGFLKQMVRNIVGTIVQVGQGKIPASEIQKILNAKDRRKAGLTAPAKGLFLVRVEY